VHQNFNSWLASQRSSIVDIDPNLISDPSSTGIRSSVLKHIDLIASYTGTDIFLLKPRNANPEIAGASYGGSIENGLHQRYRANIFGDMESVEHAKTRTLMMIDQIVSALIIQMVIADPTTAQAQD
jgi:hypothetical protein